MWIIDPPSSTIRRASAAYSSGVYGIAGHWSRLASAPEIEQVRTTGSSRLMAPSGDRWRRPRSCGEHPFVVAQDRSRLRVGDQAVDLDLWAAEDEILVDARVVDAGGQA